MLNGVQHRKHSPDGRPYTQDSCRYILLNSCKHRSLLWDCFFGRPFAGRKKKTMCVSLCARKVLMLRFARQASRVCRLTKRGTQVLQGRKPTYARSDGNGSGSCVLSCALEGSSENPSCAACIYIYVPHTAVKWISIFPSTKSFLQKATVVKGRFRMSSKGM